MISPRSILGMSACALAAVFPLSAAARPSEFDHGHTLFNEVLHEYVSDARVAYSALKAHPEKLDAYLDQVAGVGKASFDSWNEAAQLAFLINAYNAYTLRLIIEHYPIKSIRDIGNFFNGPWDQDVVGLFGDTITLNKLEHKILRVEYDEPRIHFAIVCAARGCPPLRDEAYVGDRLDAQLAEQARAFLANPHKNRIDAAAKTVYLSPIFKWFAGDFKKHKGTVLEAVRAYWPQGAVPSDYADFRIRYTNYDWTLNERVDS